MRVLKVIVTNDWGMMETNIEFFDLEEGQSLLDFVMVELNEDYDEEDLEEMLKDEEQIEVGENEIKMFFEEGMSSWYLVN